MKEKNARYIPALRYDWLTAIYDPVVRLTTREAAFKTALLSQAQIQPGQRVLDLACGTATLTIAIKQAHPQAAVIGFDGDPAILRQARAKAERSGADIAFDEGLSYELPYADDSFDHVLSSLFFHHLTRENKLRTLAEVRRVLKPGGEFHAADWGAPQNVLMKLASQGIVLLDGATTKDNFAGKLPEFIGQSGFEDVEEVRHFNSLFGTIRLHKAYKPF
ncbi:MAG: class I SAM-dependent methyltransferase [Blastocatellales bacterium]|jgi:ubiquinone/menaquinone biosynthesis C-methylase UbiE|nr:class I SAM-dependent methyltransferase [Nitrosomonas nitrosa]